MASYTIATETTLTDERLRQIYNTVKAGAIHFSYDELDTIFEIALNNRGLFPGINLAGAKNPEAYIERWVAEYRNAIINPPHSRVASPKSACSDPAIRTIVMVTQGVSETVVLEKEQAHNLFMSAENVQGNLLEEYISVSTRPYGWIWCAGNTLRAIDFCSSDGAVLLQVKNKSNTENSSSSNIRQGTTILKWYRLGTRTVRGQKVPTYKWNALNAIINDHRTLFHLPPCNMTEEHYIQFISNLANLNHDLITAE